MRQKTLVYVLFVVVLFVFFQIKLFSQDKVFINKENPEIFLTLECMNGEADGNENAIILSVLVSDSDKLYQLPSELNTPQGSLIFRENKVEGKDVMYLYEIKELGTFNLDVEKIGHSRKKNAHVGFVTGEVNLDEKGDCQLKVNAEIKPVRTRGAVSLDSLYVMYSKELNRDRKIKLMHFIRKNEDLQYSIKVDTAGLYQSYEFDIYYADSIKLLKTDLSNIDPNSLVNDNRITVSLPEEDKVSLILNDKPTSRKLTINYRYGEGLAASFSSTSFDAINFKIEGGREPYFLSFPDENGINQWGAYFELEEDNDEYVLDVNTLKASYFKGDFEHVRIYDRSKKGFVPLSLENKIPVGKDIVVSKRSNVPYYLVAGFLFLVGIWTFRTFVLKPKNKKVKYKEANKTEKLKDEDLENMPIANSKTDEETVIPEKKKRLKVINKRKMSGEILPENFSLITQSKGYSEPIQLHELWSDTVLKQIYLFVPFVEDLHDFLKRENLETVTEEKMGMVPEIGGFIMGRYATLPDVGLSLLLEEFVPFIPEYSDAFKIEIGTKTQVKELAAALEKFPDKGVMGWFHTHPGHGLFLSNPDLEVHKHFPYPFQVAMEIESLTKELDLAFFTQKENGEMNNTYTSGKPDQWFSWRDIENKLNHN